MTFHPVGPQIAQTGITFPVPPPTGATATDTPNVQNAITKLVTAGGGGTLSFQDGTYQIDGNALVITGITGFAVKGTGASVIAMAPNRPAKPNNVGGNLLTITDCTNFSVSGMVINGLRDTVAPITVLSADATSGQPAVTVAAGQGARYVVGQFLNLNGGLTVAAGAEAGQQDASLVVQSITTGASDTITFTGNLAHSYTHSAGTLSDGFGPYAAPGAYLTPWQTGTATVAGRTLAAEDQQNGLHLINCQRFQIFDNRVSAVWENGIRAGTHDLTGTAQTDGVSDGTISGNTIYHGYDQGIGLWCSSNVTVTGNDVNVGGWAGICLTGSSDCTITGNVSQNNVQRIPGDTIDGNGIAVEGGRRNAISSNRIGGNYGPGIRLTALGTLPFGSAAQVATTVAAGSNNAALPQATIHVASTTGFASAGQLTLLSSAGAQQITYTGISGGNTLTGASGGIGTMFTGQAVKQYPLFTNNGARLAIGATSTVVTDGTKFQVGGFYSIVDGPRTETFTVTVIATNTLTLAEPTAYFHPDQCQIAQSIPEETSITGNAIQGPNAGTTPPGGGDAGVLLASAIRTSFVGNTLDRAGLRGIDGVSWTSGGLQPPYGTVIYGNTITTPDVTGSGAALQAIGFQQCSDLTISGNHCTGNPSTQGGAVAIYLQGCTESVVAGNLVTDAYALGIMLDSMNDWQPRAIVVTGNEVLRCLGEGIKLFGGLALKVSGNTVAYSASNGGPGGFGGAINIRGVNFSSISDNVVYNNGRGIGLDDASINAVTVHTLNNVLSGNVAYDDGLNYDVFTGALTQQNFGIKELAAGQGPNFYSGNILQGNATNLSLTSTANPVLSFASASAGLATASLDVSTAGQGLKVAEGSNAKQGTAVLNGTTAVVVSNSSVTANSRIFLTINTVGGTPASPYVSATSAGVSFSIKSTGASDTSTVAYLITEPG